MGAVQPSRTDATSVEYSFSSRLTGQSLFTRDDVNIVGLRLADLDHSNSISLMLNGVYPTTARLRINPRLQYTYQTYSDSSDKETTIGAGLRLEYFLGRICTIEFDSGIDWTDRQVWFGNQNYTEYYINLGYRIDF